MRENTLANQALSVVLGGSELKELHKLRTMLPTNVVTVVYSVCEEAVKIAYVPEEQVHELIRPLIEVSVETVEIKIGNDSYGQDSWYHNGVCLHGHWSGDDGDYEEAGPDLTSLWDWLASLKYGTSPAGAVCVVATVNINGWENQRRLGSDNDY